MPGLPYNRPIIQQADVNSNAHGDGFGTEQADNRWEVALNLSQVQLSNTRPQAVPGLPNFGNRRQPQQSHSPWFKMREEWVNENSSVKYGSSGSEQDLQAMVWEFLEKDCESLDTSDSDSGTPVFVKFCDKLEALTSCTDSPERELLAFVSKVVLEIHGDIDSLYTTEAIECKETCVRRLLVKRLRSAFYNAGLCTCEWPSGKVPGGVYPYIDVILEGNSPASERIIVDVNFKSQFELARPTANYLKALQCLPYIFVGSEDKLQQVLEIMSEAAKCALKQNCMHLPPWRTLEYLSAKWFSPYDRKHNEPSRCRFHGPIEVPAPAPPHLKNTGGEQRKRIMKVSLLSELKGLEKEAALPALPHGRANFLKKRAPMYH